MPSLMTGWFGPGSSAYAQLTGQQASSLNSPYFSALNAASMAESTAHVLASAQAKAWRAIESALEARVAINRAHADITQARADEQTARSDMAIAAAARDAARSQALGAVANVVTGGGAAAALGAAADAADREYRRAEQALHEAQGRERRAHGRLVHAEADLRRARRDGHDAEEAARFAALGLQTALPVAQGVLFAPGAPAYGQIAAAAGIPLPQPPTTSVPLSERQPPSSWPGFLKSWFKVGRGEATALQGLWNLGSQAVEHPARVPGAIWQLGVNGVTHPLQTGKALIGYDELAAGRYEDWTGQMGIGLLLGGAGASLGRVARLRRLVGSPRIQPLGLEDIPHDSGQFAGSRADFSRADLGRHPGTRAPMLATRARAAIRAQFARDYPNGVRYTRAGFPVFTPYAIKRVRLLGLIGDNVKDPARANAQAHLPGTPEGYTWHHVEDGRTMELVPRLLNERLGHTGGAAAIREGQLGQVSPGGVLTRPERALSGAGAGVGLAGGPAAAQSGGSGR